MSMFLLAQQCFMRHLPQCIQQGSCCVHSRTCGTARFKLARVCCSAVLHSGIVSGTSPHPKLSSLCSTRYTVDIIDEVANAMFILF